MTSQTIIQELNNRAISDDYLYELLKKIQINYGFKIFEKKYEMLTERELFDILRFSDILSRSEDSLNRNISLKIISVLFDDYCDDEIYQLFSKNVLVKLGNFPSLRFLEASGNQIDNEEIELDKIIKQVFQKTTISEQYFTDSQFETFNKITNANHFSFSAGTSFGKSFLFTEYIKWLIEEKNASENIAFLVPTRALISQVVSDLSESIHNSKYKIISNPDIPAIFRNQKFIFVFTPERLISYFSEASNPNISTMIIDEAHNTIADDERSPMFYHAITLADQKSINMYFAAPNVPNPEIFLELVGNSVEESKRVLDLNVVQNKFFLDFKKNKIRIYLDFIENKSTEEIPFAFPKFEDFLLKMTNGSQSLIYCNSIHDTVEKARLISYILPERASEELNDLSDHIRETVHSNYYLAELIKRGIGFHFGALPQEIREKIEEQFKIGNIQYLFTTSTLLQGVNLPAKNLFILSDKIGLSNMSELNFRNLAGRAGRLSKELYGNIFVVKFDDKKWNDNTQRLLDYKELPDIESKILSGKKNFYKNVGNVIDDESMTNKSMPEWEKRQVADYATILTYQQKKNIPSQLIEKFSQKNPNAKSLFKKISEYEVTEDILMLSTTIKLKYQEEILNESDSFIFELEFDHETCLKILLMLYKKYRWDIEEDKRGLGNINKLSYYAVLMTEWIESKPLNLIIQSSIRLMDRNDIELSINHDPKNREIFSRSNPSHVNQVINDLLKDIENILRFKVKNYIMNYLKLTDHDDGEWQKYLEYGTNNQTIIELQKIGFERQVAIELEERSKEDFSFNSKGEIVEINSDGLLLSPISVEAKKQIEMLLL